MLIAYPTLLIDAGLINIQSAAKRACQGKGSRKLCSAVASNLKESSVRGVFQTVVDWLVPPVWTLTLQAARVCAPPIPSSLSDSPKHYILSVSHWIIRCGFIILGIRVYLGYSIADNTIILAIRSLYNITWERQFRILMLS